jgi:hypothetical protein
MREVLIVLLSICCVTVVASAQPKPITQLNLPKVEAQPWRFKEFPIVAWWSPPGTASDEDFRAYKDCGFTLYLANPDAGFPDALVKAKRAGMKILCMRLAGGFGLPALKNPTLPENDPDVVAWLTSDEPNNTGSATQNITEVNTLMRKDPTCRAFFNMLPPRWQTDPPAADLLDACARNGQPIFSYDQYVIYTTGKDDPEIFYSALDLYRQKSIQHNVPFWAFAITINCIGFRDPSESDLRWQQFSNLAYGAKGLWYFTYWAPKDWPNWAKEAIVTNEGKKTKLYDHVKTLNETVSAMGQTLLGLTNVDAVHTNPPAGQRKFAAGKFWISDVKGKDVLIGFFKNASGDDYALVVNTQHGMKKSSQETADEIELSFDPKVKSVTAESWLDGHAGPLTLKEGKATLNIAGGTGVLLHAN